MIRSVVWDHDATETSGKWTYWTFWQCIFEKPRLESVSVSVCACEVKSTHALKLWDHAGRFHVSCKRSQSVILIHNICSSPVILRVFFFSLDDKQWHCLKGGNTRRVFNSANTLLATITCSHISMGLHFFHSNLMIHQKPVVCFISANGFVYKFRICKHCTCDDLYMLRHFCKRIKFKYGHG